MCRQLFPDRFRWHEHVLFLPDAADFGSWRFVCRLIMLFVINEKLVQPFILCSFCRNMTSVTRNTNENHAEEKLNWNIRHEDAAAVYVKSS